LRGHISGQGKKLQNSADRGSGAALDTFKKRKGKEIGTTEIQMVGRGGKRNDVTTFGRIVISEKTERRTLEKKGSYTGKRKIQKKTQCWMTGVKTLRICFHISRKPKEHATRARWETANWGTNIKKT